MGNGHFEFRAYIAVCLQIQCNPSSFRIKTHETCFYGTNFSLPTVLRDTGQDNYSSIYRGHVYSEQGAQWKISRVDQLFFSFALYRFAPEVREP